MTTKTVELGRVSSIKIVYPPEYLASFNQSNKEVVQRFFDYLQNLNDPDSIKGLVVSRVNAGHHVACLVTESGDYYFIDEINWAEPGKDVSEYPGYNFHHLSGDIVTQTKRVAMLGQKLNCFTGAMLKSELEATGITIPSRGRITCLKTKITFGP